VRLDRRHACKCCGAHLIGRSENDKHPFHVFDFIHADLSVETRLGAVRARLKELKLDPYPGLFCYEET